MRSGPDATPEKGHLNEAPTAKSMMKRFFDIVVAAVGLLLLLPLFALVAVLIRRGSPGPVFFRQERVGLHGRLFRIFKFRTMVADAPSRGPALTAGPDPRITWVGGHLRRYKIDELPQLINVLTGSMSFVGPRPEVPRYVALYTPEQRRVLDVRPGITDPASLTYRHEADMLARAVNAEEFYVHEVMPVKLQLNLDYLNRRSFARDIGVILYTVFASLKG